MREQLKLENQLCFPLYAAARKVTGFYSPHLKPLGITYTQYLVFLVLWEKGSQTVGDLSFALHLDSGTLTPVLKKLEAGGYVTRSRSIQDERIVNISLTDKGKVLEEKAAEIPACLASSLPFSEKETMELYRLLYRVLEYSE
ncbi:MAG: MarR family transcriptional regulator [Solobacterium sp.]|nr:MarR family transcriptional regulator [Solobacterium sp.]